MDSVGLSTENLSIPSIIAKAASPQSGAINVFIGTTRDTFEEKKVLELSYETYDEMAIIKMKEICIEIRNRWPINKIVMEHKIGICPVGEASIVIAISAAHRVAAIEATHFAIDTLKATVPIWKKEIYEDGSTLWKANDVQNTSN